MDTFFQNNQLIGQIITSTEDYIEKVKTSANSMTIEFNDHYKNFTLEISGPENYYLKKELKEISEFELLSMGIEGHSFQDGGYMIQVTPNFEKSEDEQKVLRYLTATDQWDRLKAEKELLNLPSEVQKYNRYVSVKDGEYILPENEATGLKTIKRNKDPFKNLSSLRLASVKIKPTFTNLHKKTQFSYTHLGLNDPQPLFVDQQILDDLIVDGSACIGQDCVNGESFGFDTIRVKENNLRIRAQDTSTSASFPSRDWQITFNDSANGGANKFSIDDIDGGRTPFTIEASAPSHSLYVDDGGRLGLGTATPVADVHVKSGNTPTNRLEQDGTSGFGAQTWDLAGNEANFFIRDASNGSTLPFRIFPGAPSNALTIEASTGDIGLGTTSPDQNLDIEDNIPVIRLTHNGSGTHLWDIQANDLGFNIIDATGGVGDTVLTITTLNQLNLTQYKGGSFDEASPSYSLTMDGSGNVTRTAYSGGAGTDDQTLAEVLSSGSNADRNINLAGFLINNLGEPLVDADAATKKYVDDSADIDWVVPGAGVTPTQLTDHMYTLGKIAIGDNITPEQELHVVGNVAISGSILPVSDRRLKKDILPIDNALTTLQQLNAASYNFRTEEFSDMNLLTGLQYGFIAQELEKVIPTLVTDSNNPDKEKAFKRVNYTGLIPFLVKGMQEQQDIIEDQEKEMVALQQQIDGLQQKLNEVDQLKEQVAALAKLMSINKDDPEASLDTQKK